jgi:hypothetical protein
MQAEKPKKPLSAGRVEDTQAKKLKPPVLGVKRYVLTSAQNNTPVYKDCWHNLLALVNHYGAKLMVSRYTYDKSSYGKKAVKPDSSRTSDYDNLWYSPEISPYISDERVELAPGLVWCGELNILPTAVDPLSGLESYTGRASGIFPHAKFAMDSVASGKLEATKFNYTTGTITQRNYIQKKAGLKAEHFHGYGALLVEVTEDGAWYVRQLQATESGSIRDLDLLATGGEVSEGHRVEAISWGDVHTRLIDPVIRKLNWGVGGMLDVLCPKYQFIHDVLDFRARNHHEIKNGLSMHSRYVEAKECVQEEVREASELIREAIRPWCHTVVVDSNHDKAMIRWLVETDFRKDPVNARYFLEASLALYYANERQDRDFHLLEWAMAKEGLTTSVQFVRHGQEIPGSLRFLREDESFVVCHSYAGGVENGMHGDLGPNGARGSIRAFARMGRRANVAHSHSAGIFNEVYQAGTSSMLDLGYNRGPSSWSHTHIVTYPEGTRSMVTLWKGRWRA